MKDKYTTLAAIVVVILLGCITLYRYRLFTQYSPEIETVLKLAGNNRKELEKVLQRYSQQPEDSLKYKAACFLIENMPNYYYWEGEQLDHHMEYYRMLAEKPNMSPYVARDSVIKRYGPLSQDQAELKYDIRELDSAYLCHNIEWSFKVWQEQPWGKHVSFADFCEYILPYRLDNEKPVYWKQTFYETYQPMLQSLLGQAGADDPLAAARMLTDSLRRGKPRLTMVAPPGLPRRGPFVTKHMSGSCQDISDFVVYACRSVGIPCAIDYIPMRGNVNTGHSWVAFWDKKKELYMQDFLGEITFARDNAIRSDAKAKVYRYTFSRNRADSKAMAKLESSVPPEFGSYNFIDVTLFYSDCMAESITIPAKHRYSGKTKAKIAYLCLPCWLNWVPVAWTEINDGDIRFSNIHKGHIMRVATWEDGRLVFQTPPFQLQCPTGKMVFFEPEDAMQEITLLYKFSIELDHLFRCRMVGGVFEGSNTPDFSQRDTIFMIEQLPDRLLTQVNVKSDQMYRYVRYRGPDWSSCNISEAAFYEAVGDTVALTGKVMGTPGCYQNDGSHEYTNVFDGRTDTSFDYKEPHGGWAGLDLGVAKIVSRIVYTHRNGDDYVRPGDTYEFFYCDRDWVSLGRQVATSDSLAYTVPSGTLYYLKNHTRGIQERIFAYEEGKQHFW